MEKRSFELLKAAIPEAEAYGIDTTVAKEVLKVSEGSCWVCGAAARYDDCTAATNREW